MTPPYLRARRRQLLWDLVETTLTPIAIAAGMAVFAVYAVLGYGGRL